MMARTSLFKDLEKISLPEISFYFKEEPTLQEDLINNQRKKGNETSSKPSLAREPLPVQSQKIILHKAYTFLDGTFYPWDEEDLKTLENSLNLSPFWLGILLTFSFTAFLVDAKDFYKGWFITNHLKPHFFFSSLEEAKKYPIYKISKTEIKLIWNPANVKPGNCPLGETPFTCQKGFLTRANHRESGFELFCQTLNKPCPLYFQSPKKTTSSYENPKPVNRPSRGKKAIKELGLTPEEVEKLKAEIKKLLKPPYLEFLESKTPIQISKICKVVKVKVFLTYTLDVLDFSKDYPLAQRETALQDLKDFLQAIKPLIASLEKQEA